jgi:hypothetical protein
MPEYLRIEVNNFKWLVDDTEDLSTRRGGSLLALDLIEYVKTTFASSLEAISTGASIGIFQVSAGNNLKPLQNLVDKVNESLAKHVLFGHATWSVATVGGEDFKPAEETLIFSNRWQQMQSLSFSPEGLFGATPSINACTKDLLRPAIDGKFSASTKAKRADGLKKKRAFYKSQLGELDPMVARYITGSNTLMAWDLEQVASDPGKRFGNLGDKIAVFYADGNSFGEIAQSASTAKALSDWDTYIKRERRKMLGQVFELVSSPTARSNEDESEVRLETLLWGGDEIMFVVPAWLGLRLAEQFFTSTKDWQWEYKKPSKPEPLMRNLTHSCGLVFCKNSAPISTIQRLAKTLAEHCKDKSRSDNLLGALVLESFDTVGDDIEEAISTQFSQKLSFENLILSDDSLFKLVESLPNLAASLPKSAATRALHLLLERPTDDAAWPHHKLLARSYDNIEGALTRDGHMQSFKDLWMSITAYEWQVPKPVNDHSFIEAHLAGWSALLSLWDYAVLPEVALA